jgi:two-component system nitrogen regulation response regulator GlnG
MAPLRERQGDIRLLVDFFLRKIGGGSNGSKSIGEKTLSVLEAYHWPGNIRELENVLRRAVVVSKGAAILENDLPPEILQTVRSAPSIQASRTLSTPTSATSAGQLAQGLSTPADPSLSAPCIEAALATNLDPAITGDIRPLVLQLFRWARLQGGIKVLPAVERELVIEALKETQGNQVQAAKLLGITRATLRKRVDKFGIRRELSVS